MVEPRVTIKIPPRAIARLQSFVYAASARHGRRVTLGEALIAAVDVAGEHLAEVDQAIVRTHPAVEVPQ